MREETIAVYCEDLRECDPETLMQAVVQLRRTSKWLPSIAEIRAALVTQAHHFPTAAEAWVLVSDRMAKQGTYHSMGRGAGDPMFRALELCGRWEDCCQEDPTWLRKRYVEIYEGLIAEIRTGLATGVKPPWLQMATTLVGLPSRPPRIEGNSDA
jgi:hypothetical protein